MRRLIPFSLFLLSACELIVDVDVPFDPTKIVVNALQRTDNPWYVELAHTKPVTGPQDYSYVYIPEATVFIHNPDGSTETLKADQSGIFHGVGSPKAGETYKITVEAPGMESAEAQMTMPLVVPIVDVKWDSTTVAEQTSRPHVHFVNVPFTVSFTDASDTKNYYAVRVSEKIETSNLDPDGIVHKDTIWRVREEAIQNDPGIATEDEYKVYFPDNTFAGQTYTGHFKHQFVNEEGERRLEIQVLLLSVSEDFYKYQETKKLQNDVRGDPFAQPVQVYSNVSSGFGIFAGNSIDFWSWGR